MHARSILGYTLAVLAIPIVLATFLGNNYFSHKLVDATGIKLSPWDTGGKVVRIIDHGQYHTLLHRPVFDGLIGEKPEGFIQIDWEPKNSLPALITEDIDYDQDGDTDFRIIYEPAANKTILQAYNSRVLSLEGSYKLKDKCAVRVDLRNK